MVKELIAEQVTIGNVNFVRALLFGVPAILWFMTLYYIYKWTRTQEMIYKAKTFFFAVILLMVVSVISPVTRKADYIAGVLQDVESGRVAKYYDMRKDGEYLKLDRKDNDVPDFLKKHEKAKILKETPESYQVEYNGKIFDVEK